MCQDLRPFYLWTCAEKSAASTKAALEILLNQPLWVWLPNYYLHQLWLHGAQENRAFVKMYLWLCLWSAACRVHLKDKGKKREQGFIKSIQQEYFCAVLIQTGQLIRELYTVLFKLKGPNSILASSYEGTGPLQEDVWAPIPQPVTDRSRTRVQVGKYGEEVTLWID